MDLVESEIFQGQRHPWEISRVDAVRRLLGGYYGDERPIKALDLGCGDGYVSGQLFGESGHVQAALVDLWFTDDMVARMDDHGGRFKFHKSLEESEISEFDLIIMLDVLEHEQDDLGLLAKVVSRLSDSGVVLLTVPAFQSLFSAHDRFLRHHRRYNRGQLVTLARQAGLAPVSSGYLYGSLILPRFLSLTLQKLGVLGGEEPKGVGGWSAGSTITNMISGVLSMENSVMIHLARAGIRLPGLTAWAVCHKQT